MDTIKVFGWIAVIAILLICIPHNFFLMLGPMILVNTDFVDGREIAETLSLVKGSTIRTKNMAQDIIAVFRHLVGGEVKEYTHMIEEARKIAISRMVKEAEKLEADAIVNIRFSTAAVMQGAAEIVAYGTAVKLK